LKCEQLTEHIADTDAREKISTLADVVFFLFIISINGTIERELHEAGEGDNAVLPGFTPDYFEQRVQVL
jgi:hypothetical protein